MSKLTIFERRQDAARATAIKKVQQAGGSHAFPFGYRNAQVFVRATENNGKITVRTEPTKNKGK